MTFLEEKLNEYGLIVMKGSEQENLERFREEYCYYPSDWVLKILANEERDIVIENTVKFVEKVGINKRYLKMSRVCYELLKVDIDSSEQSMNISTRYGFREVDVRIGKYLQAPRKETDKRSDEELLWAMFASEKEVKKKVEQMSTMIWELIVDQDADEKLIVLKNELTEALEKDKKKNERRKFQDNNVGTIEVSGDLNMKTELTKIKGAV